MAYNYPYDEELRKVPLNPEMIRHQVREDAKHDLTIGLLMGIPIMAIFSGVLALMCSAYPWKSNAISILFGILGIVIFAAVVLIGILFVALSIRNYRRAVRGEITVVIDKVNYIEHDRPRKVHHKGHTHTVYEDFLHFHSGREYKDAEQKYRHMNIDDEEFITAAYAADYNTIRCIFRLSEYNWQE